MEKTFKSFGPALIRKNQNKWKKIIPSQSKIVKIFKIIGADLQNTSLEHYISAKLNGIDHTQIHGT